LVKLLLLRYGGLRAHRTALPIFLGLLAGDATVSFLLEIAFAIIGQRIWLPPRASGAATCLC
jgi:hypothetical protein